MSRWTVADLKSAGWTGGGFADRRRVFQAPDGSLSDDRDLQVAKKAPESALNRPLANAKPSKYRNKPEGGYASKREAKRAAELAFLAHACQISELEAQVRYELIPKQKGERPCHYIADFRYRDAEGALVVEDTKGYRTPEYRIKRKLMLWVHGIRVIEV